MDAPVVTGGGSVQLGRMKILIPFLLAGAALTGCVAVPYDAGPPPGTYYNSRPAPPPPHAAGRPHYDRDGVPDRYDRRPDNPYRY